MAHTTAAPPRVSLTKQWLKFTNSNGGLDLTLRLIQALTMIATEVCMDKAIVTRCDTATAQLAMGESVLSPVHPVISVRLSIFLRTSLMRV